MMAGCGCGCGRGQLARDDRLKLNGAAILFSASFMFLAGGLGNLAWELSRWSTMQQNKEIISRFVDETLNKGNIDAAGEFVWEDMIEQVPFPGQGPGLDGLKDVLRGMREAFPDMRWVLQEQVAEGETVVTRSEWTGTHRGPFLRVPATGRAVRVWGIVIDRLVGGKLKESRMLMDTLGLMAQLGVFPPPAGAR